MGYSAAGIALDSIIEKDVIYRWSAVKEGTAIEYNSIAGTWSSTVHNTYWTGNAIYNESVAAAINDQLGIGCLQIPKDGTYEIHIIARRGSCQGISHIFLNNVDKGTIDWYGASTTGHLGTGTLGALTKGSYTLSLKMASKNASSSDYAMTVQSVIIVKTP